MSNAASLICSSPRVRPIACKDSPAFQRFPRSDLCSAESFHRLLCAIKHRLLKTYSCQLQLHRPVEPAAYCRHVRSAAELPSKKKEWESVWANVFNIEWVRVFGTYFQRPPAGSGKRFSESGANSTQASSQVFPCLVNAPSR